MPAGKNLILEVKNDAACFTLSTDALRHFMLLVSNTEIDGGGVIASNYAAKILPEAIKKELLDTGNIEIDNGSDVILGEDDQLFTNKSNPFRELSERVYKEFIKPIQSKKRVNVQISEAANRLTFFMGQPDTIRKPGDIASIYSDAYGVITGQPFGRSFTLKEIGQFKHLFKYYGATTCVQLIIHYIIGTGMPSVGGLLSKKDYLYNKIRGKSKNNETASEADEESLFV